MTLDGSGFGAADLAILPGLWSPRHSGALSYPAALWKRGKNHGGGVSD